MGAQEYHAGIRRVSQQRHLTIMEVSIEKVDVRRLLCVWFLCWVNGRYELRGAGLAWMEQQQAGDRALVVGQSRRGLVSWYDRVGFLLTGALSPDVTGLCIRLAHTFIPNAEYTHTL
jgi:hypothetical protein